MSHTIYHNFAPAEGDMRPATSQGFYLHHLPYYALLSQVFQGARVLQLGGGAFTARYAEHLGALVTCALPSAREAAHNQSLHRDSDVEFIDVRLPTLPFIDDAFNVVMAFDVTGSMDDPRAFLSEVRRVLAPGGFALFTLPNFRRDELQEVMGEVSRNIPERNSAQIYGYIAKLFPHMSSLSQTPFLGYMMAEHEAGRTPRPFNLSYELVEDQPDAPLYTCFLASDLEVVLEEDRLVQVPFSHLVDRLQGGLRTYNRMLERKTNALLDLRAEIKHLQTDQDQLEQKAREAEGRAQALENSVAQVLELIAQQQHKANPDSARLLNRLAHHLENADKKPLLQPTSIGKSSLAEGSFGVSNDEMRLLMEGLQGGDIEQAVSALGDSTSNSAQDFEDQATHRRVMDLLVDDAVFQEDLTPFQLPGPVPLAKVLRSELQTQRLLLSQRDAQLRAIETWRRNLLNVLGSTLNNVDEHVAQLRHWNRIDPLTQSWEQFAQLLTELTTAAVSEHPQDDWRLDSKHAAAIAIEKLQDQIVDLETRLTQTLQEDAVLRRELGRTDKHIQDLSQQRDELQSHIQALDVHVEQLQGGNSQLRKQLHDVSVQHGLWQEELAAQEGQLAELNSQLEIQQRQFEQRSSTAQAELATLNENNQIALQAERHSARKNLEDSQQKARQDLADQRAKASADISALKSRVLDIEDQRDRLQRQLTDAERAKAQSEQDLAVSKQGAKTLREELQSALKAEAALRASLDASHLSESALNSELSGLRQSQLELRSQLSTAYDELQVAQKQLLDSRSRETDLQDELDSSLRARKSLQSQVDDLKETQNHLEESQNTLQQSNETLQNTLSQAKDRLEGELALAEAAKAELERKLGSAITAPPNEPALQTPSKSELQEHQAQLNALQNELQFRQDAVDKQAKSLADALASARAHEQARQKAEAELKMLKTQFQNSKAQVESGQKATISPAPASLPDANHLFDGLLKRIQRTLATGDAGSASDSPADLSEQLRQQLPGTWSKQLQRVFNESDRLMEGFSDQLQRTHKHDQQRIQIKQERDKLAMQLKALEGQANSVPKASQTELDRLKRELRDVNNERQNLERALAKARNNTPAPVPETQDLQRLQGELAEAREQLDEAKQVLEAHDEEMIELKDEIQRAWSRALNTDSTTPPGNAGSQDLGSTTVPHPKGSDKELLARLATLEKTLETRDLQYNRLQKELALKSTHNRNLQEMIGRQRDELKRVRNKVKQALAYIEVLRSRQGLRGKAMNFEEAEDIKLDY